MNANENDYLLRERLMNEWWEEGLGERPKLTRHGTYEGWDNIVLPWFLVAKEEILENFGVKQFRLELNSSIDNTKPEFLTKSGKRHGFYNAEAVRDVTTSESIAERLNVDCIFHETEEKQNYNLQMYLFFCLDEDAGIMIKNGINIKRQCLTVKEVEFLVAVALSDNFGDAELILRAMPYFKKVELPALFEAVQTWLTGQENLDDVRDYVTNHYQATYNLIMTPLRNY